MIAVDFGANDALALHSHDGPMTPPKRPRIAGGASKSDKFIGALPLLLAQDDVVIESATVGSSGVEVEDVAEIVAGSPHHMYVISGRAVKNYRADNAPRWRPDNALQWRKGARYVKDGGPAPRDIEIDEQTTVHAEDAEIIYRIAIEFPERLRLWRAPDDQLQRTHTSVRPHDKRNYRGPVPDMYIDRFPPFEQLPIHLQKVLGTGTARKRDYSRAKAMPFAMAMDEVGADTRSGYEKIIGLYEHGYPSFYRRATIVLMQNVAKELASVTRIEEVPPAVRKMAWKVTRKYIREIYHLLHP